MLVPATTTITPLGEVTSTTYGDELDSETALAEEAIPASIIEGRETVATESDPQARIIRYYIGRVPYGTDTTGWERIRDDRSGQVYVIDNVTAPTNPAVPMDTRLDLRRVT
jgi:hypothetical protein